MCWTLPNAPALFEAKTDVSSYKVSLQFKKRNGSGEKIKTFSPFDFDVVRPTVGSLGYVVRGPRVGSLVKVVKLDLDKATKAVNGLEVKLPPYTGKGNKVVVGLRDLTKVERRESLPSHQ